MLENIIDSCQYLLNNYPDAKDCRDYLNSRLNIDTQQLFQFGYFPPTNILPVLISLVGKEMLINYKLLYSKDIEDSLYFRTLDFSFFENYPLIMPYKNAYGETIAIVGRTLLSEEERKLQGIAKYKNTVFQKGNHLFGLNYSKSKIIEQDCVYIVEGQFDVIKSIQSGMTNIVALGNSNMSYNQFTLITRYTNNIFLLLDNDDAGIKGRQRIYKLFHKYANIRNFYLPEEYKDIDEFFSNNSYDDLSLIVKD